MWSNIDVIRSFNVKIFFGDAFMWPNPCKTFFYFFLDAAPPENPEKRGFSCLRAREVHQKRVSKGICWSKLVPNWLRCCVSQLNTQTKTLSSRPQTACNVSYRYEYSRVSFWRKRSDFRLSSLEFPRSFIWKNPEYGPDFTMVVFWDYFWGYFPGSVASKTSFFVFSGFQKGLV